MTISTSSYICTCIYILKIISYTCSNSPRYTWLRSRLVFRHIIKSLHKNSGLGSLCCIIAFPYGKVDYRHLALWEN